METIIKTQKEYDDLPSNTTGYIYIEGGTDKSPLNLYREFTEAVVIVRGNATINDVYGNATINDVYGNATIKYVYGNATINDVNGNATINDVYDNATINDVYDNATIKYVRDNAKIKLMTGLACVLMVTGYAQVTTAGCNIVRYPENEKNVTLHLSPDTTKVIVPSELYNPESFENYMRLYPIEIRKDRAVMYKMVHKVDGKYVSDYDASFTYQIGRFKREETAPSENGSCSRGIHVAFKQWAVSFGKHWKDAALLECEVPIGKIVVSKDTDGKVRTSELKVVREVPKEEWL